MSGFKGGLSHEGPERLERSVGLFPGGLEVFASLFRLVGRLKLRGTHLQSLVLEPEYCHRKIQGSYLYVNMMY